jgi:hypothetical protein
MDALNNLGMIFRSRLRRKIEFEILKLKLQLAEIKQQKSLTKAHDTSKQVDLILREKNIERDISLYRKILE